MNAPASDPANGYERVATAFIASRSAIGAELVRRWARGLPDQANVLELGCGHGVPISQVLVDAGVILHAVDASPTLLAAFRRQFPAVPVQCQTVEDSDFFQRTFDAVIAWGLVFLLAPDVQERVLRKVAAVLRPGGSFFFTAPEQACAWTDVLTGLRSVSLGAEGYRRLLSAEGLTVVAQERDEGDNHAFVVTKHQT